MAPGCIQCAAHFCFSIIIIPPRKSCPAILMARTERAVAAAINLVVTIKCTATPSRRIIYIRLPTWRTKAGELERDRARLSFYAGRMAAMLFWKKSFRAEFAAGERVIDTRLIETEIVGNVASIRLSGVDRLKMSSETRDRCCTPVRE